MGSECMCLYLRKTINDTEGVMPLVEIEGQKIQWQKEKEQTIICKTLHSKTKL